jgi:hypothetical protein
MIDTALAFDAFAMQPRVGEIVAVRGDVLAEVVRHARGAQPCWQFVAAGTRGKLLGWRAARAVVEIEEHKLAFFLGATSITPVRPANQL